MAVAVVAGAGACAGNEAAPAAAQQVAVEESEAGRPSTKTIADLFAQWDATLATGNPQNVADRYATDAVLLPTVSNEVRTDRAGIVDYFDHFLENKPRGVIKKSYVDVLDQDTAIDTGVYVFTLTEDGEEREVEARYTFVYELRGDKWLIVNHHSSAMPE